MSGDQRSRVFVDTSALIALLDADDHRHAEAGAAFSWLLGSAELVTHNYVQVEAVAVAGRRLGAAAAQRLIDSLFPVMRTLWVDDVLHATAAEAFRVDSGPSFVDQVSFALMRREGIDQAFAFDADFANQRFRSVKPPSEARQRRLSEAPGSYPSYEVAPELVSVAEISSRAGRPINTIQSWRRRHSDFPRPVAQLAAGPIWNWSAISEWIARRPPARP